MADGTGLDAERGERRGLRRGVREGCGDDRRPRAAPEGLGRYAAIAFELAGLGEGDEDGFDDDDQGGAPGELDNRPAHRILFAYAGLLRRRDPEAAAVWFTALVYLNPNDNVGARFIAPDGPRDSRF
ncbi:hypothetical protein ACFXKJ_27150 [Kitasatospora indigofera]|uniref:hypothetical protein n=1 Tax=Kitasatospora indigofera TaxID=67307 RepID=UPI0036A8EE01